MNNRPDGEDPGQFPAARGAELAHAAGLEYVHIPVTTQGLGPADVQAFADALASSPGPVLAHCRSGTRSTILWAMAAAKQGKQAPDEILRLAQAAGYDLSAQRPILEGYARQAG
ncbi:TIGR01244 family sulfur transferase [Aerophototrophica crusticola]|uniref:TIGR01244 family sulfur transferase n=1 Tax=Aerophototrophica crusticola TaxID=1709002 RepID=UPI00384E4A03